MYVKILLSCIVSDTTGKIDLVWNAKNRLVAKMLISGIWLSKIKLYICRTTTVVLFKVVFFVIGQFS